jgi:guanine deaminase
MNTSKAYRAQLLRFDDGQNIVFDQDGLLVIDIDQQGRWRIVDLGPYDSVIKRHINTSYTHWPQNIIAPGFIDMHAHYPQSHIIGAPAAGLLPWLEKYTFPEESRFDNKYYGIQVAKFFLDEMLRNGVTTALTFGTSHPESVDAFFEVAQSRKLRMMCGKVLQDRHSPEGVQDQTEQSLIDSEALIQKWHNQARLGYAITPRFAPTSSEAQLAGAGELAARYPDTWIQSHLSENQDEIAWVKQLYPHARSYLSVYEQYGLLRERAIYAHCIHIDQQDRALMREMAASAAVCPTSNLFLGSGFFDFKAADEIGMAYGLASDIGGGTSFSPFRTMLAAYYVGREGQLSTGLSIPPSQLWWRHTVGAAKALGLDGVVGNLAIGHEADFIVMNPNATPLLAKRVGQANSIEELLFALIVLGDDRVIEKTIVAEALL